MIRLATVGTSAIADNFLAGAALTGEFEHCAVYSRNRETGEAFALKHNARTVYTSLEAMTKSGIDAVYIASPNVFHAEQSRIFLENGIHVICEKPITCSCEEYKTLKAIADSRGLIYMEAIIPRHVAARNAVKQALGEIGKISLARIDFCQRSSRLDAFLSGKQMNIFDMSLHAGTLMDLGVYCVYAAVDLLGEPDSITANASYLSNGADGAGGALFAYDGFTAVISYSKCGQTAIGSEIVGEGGTLKIVAVSQYAGVTLVKNGKETAIVGFPTKAELMSGEAQRFADYIKAGHQCEDYKAASLLCEQVHTCMDKIKSSAGIVYPKL